MVPWAIEMECGHGGITWTALKGVPPRGVQCNRCRSEKGTAHAHQEVTERKRLR